MGRPNKKGLEFFPVNVSIFDDIKIKKLIRKSDGKSFSVYQWILSAIYRDSYYIKLDEDLVFFISDSLKFDEQYVRDVIKDCLDVGLFDRRYFDSDNILTSKGIQERYVDIMKICRRLIQMDEYVITNGIKSEQKPVVSEVSQITSEENPVPSHINKSKQKEQEKKFGPEEYLKIYNKLTNSVFSLFSLKFAKENIEQLVRIGYQEQDFENAICNAIKDEFIRSKRLTPEWLIRPENFEKYAQKHKKVEDSKPIEQNENPDGKRKIVKANFNLNLKTV